MTKHILQTSLFLLVLVIASCGEKKFTKLPSGIEYKIVKKGKGKVKATEGSIIKMHIVTKLKDTTLYDSYKQNNNEPVPAQVNKPAFNGDIMEGLTMMSEGDSAIFKVPADSLFRGGPMPEFAKTGDVVTFTVKMVSIKSKEEYQTEMEAESAAQVGKDDKIIQDYLAKNGLQAQKTASGIYYIIEKTGNGKHPTASNTVKVHYKGTLLDGTKFDSSYDRNEPAEFPLNQVIKGWTEGIPLLDEGGKGKLIIPSGLAYGANPQPGSPIKPHSVLQFEVELIKIVK
jgi:FKBP-type peptidyl-prolyl cis-trans isomerase FkpA